MSTSPTSERRTTVAFRLDDVSNRSSSDLEANLFEAFRKHQIPLIIAVVPRVCAGDFADPRPQPLSGLSAEKAAFLRTQLSLGFLELAQHGFSHQTTLAAAKNGRPAEFQGIDHAAQREKIQAGRAELEMRLSREVRIFAPPWNKYDLVTLRVLQELGFLGLVAGENGGPVGGDSGLRFLPTTTNLFDIDAAIEEARRSGDPAPVVVGLFHEYDFDSARQRTLTLERLGAILDRVGERPDVATTAVSELFESPASSFERYRELAKLRSVERSLPRSTHRLLRSSYYPSPRFIRRSKVVGWGLLVGILGSVAVTSALALLATELLVGRTWPDRGLWSQAGLILITVCCLLVGGRVARSAWRLRRLYFRQAAALSLVLGLLVGVLAIGLGG